MNPLGAPVVRIQKADNPQLLSEAFIDVSGEPVGTRKMDTQNRFDLRLEKRFRVGMGAVSVMGDIFNLFNSNTVIRLKDLRYGSPNFGLPAELQTRPGSCASACGGTSRMRSPPSADKRSTHACGPGNWPACRRFIRGPRAGGPDAACGALVMSSEWAPGPSEALEECMPHFTAPMRVAASVAILAALPVTALGQGLTVERIPRCCRV